jgi:hypothetical protein
MNWTIVIGVISQLSYLRGPHIVQHTLPRLLWWWKSNWGFPARGSASPPWMFQVVPGYHFCKREPHLRFCYKGRSVHGLSVLHLHVSDWKLCGFWKGVAISLTIEVPSVSDIQGCETLCTTSSMHVPKEPAAVSENRFLSSQKILMIEVSQTVHDWITRNTAIAARDVKVIPWHVGVLTKSY